MGLNLSNRLSAITQDAAGTTHLAWVENNKIWHATYDVNAQDWINAQAVVEFNGQSLKHLTIVADPNLITASSSSTAPGVAIIYQEGIANDSEIFYTAAQYNANGMLQWLPSPQALTADTVGDLDPRAIVNDGIITVVGQKVNVDQASNQAIREDTDLYYQTFSVSSSQFSTTTPPPSLNPAPYAPRTVQDGVIQGNYPVISISPPAPAAAYTPFTSKELQTAASNSLALGINYNVSQSFDTNLAKALLKKFPNIPQGLVEPFLGNLNFGGTLQGSSGNNPNFSLFGGGVSTDGLLINASGFLSVGLEAETGYSQGVDEDFSKKPSVTGTGTLASLFSYTKDNNNNYLGTVTGSVLLTAGVSVPIPIPGIKATPFYLSGVGSLGSAIQWQYNPKNPDEYFSPIGLVLNNTSEGIDAAGLAIVISIPPLGAIAGIGLAVFSGIEGLVEGIISAADPGNSQAINLESLLLGIPIASIGIEGGVKIPLIFDLGIGAALFGTGTIGYTQGQGDFSGGITVGIPLTATAKVFGYLGGTIGIFPTWTISFANDSSSTLATPDPANSENTASVSGSLLTVSFPQGLDPTVNVDPSQFTVTSASMGTIPVFGAIISGNNLILRLSTPIPYTTQNGEPVSDITLTYSYTPDKIGQGVLLDKFQQPIASTTFSVTNNTPQTFTYNYNPVGGTGNIYAVNQQQVIIQFNTDLDSNFIPDASQFTITDANNKSFTVNQVSLNNQRVLLTLPNSLSTSYTVSYTQNSNGANNLKTADGTAVDNFSVNSANAPTSVGLVNRTFTNSGLTNQLLANVASDFAQDTSPAMALVPSTESTPSNPNYDLLLAWSSDAPPLTPISSIIIGNQIYLTFAQDLNYSSQPLPTQFTYSDSTLTTTNVQISDKTTVILTVNQTIPNNVENLTINYNLYSNTSSSNIYSNNLYVTDATGNQFWVPDFTVNLQNYGQVSSTTAPNILVATATTTLLTLVFDQVLSDQNATPNSSQFTVISNNVAIPVNQSVTVSENSVVLTLAQGINQGDVVTVSYQADPSSTGSNLQNNSNVLVNSFQNQSVITTPSTATTVIKTAFSPFGNSGISATQSIIGTTGLNFDPVAIFDPKTKTNFVAWVNVDGSAFTGLDIPGQTYTQSEADQINTAISQSTIYYSQLLADNTWSIAAQIPTPSGQNTNVALGIGPNQEIMAAWLNTQSTASGSTSTTIYWSSWTGSAWTTPAPIRSDLTADPHTDLTISHLGENPAIFWTSTQPPSYREVVESASPSVYLRLGELTGSTARNLGTFLGAANGTYTGTYTLNQPGALENTTDSPATGDPNPAVLFSGGGVTLNQPVPLNSQGFSVEFWFKLPEIPTQSLNLVSMSGAFGLGLEVIDSKPYLTFGLVDGESSAVQVDPSLDGNTWYYVVGTYNGSTQVLTLYLNGQPIGQQTQQDPTLPLSGILTLASTPGTSVYLDEVAFYPNELTYADINASALTAANFQTVTATQLLGIISGTNQVGNHYTARYNAPVAPGPQTFSAIWDGKAWSLPSLIEPKLAITPTSLSDANRPAWDIVSATPVTTADGESTVSVSPNGISDSLFIVTLPDQQNKVITGIQITAGSQAWAVGQSGVVVEKNNSTETLEQVSGTPLSGNQLGVMLGNRLLNPLNPSATTFKHTILSAQETLNLYVDTGSAEGNSNQITNATITIYYESKSRNDSNTQNTQFQFPNPKTSVSSNSEPLTPGQVSVLGVATVTEANDSSLALIDSGFIIDTDVQGMGSVLASGFKPSDNKLELAYVAVGNRGLTDASGNSIQGGTIQILLAQGPALTNSSSEALTTKTINAGGILIEGITDKGEVNKNVAMSLATGDVDGDGIDDLVIGDANADNGQGAIYLIYGSYLVNNPNSTIDLRKLQSDQGIRFKLDGLGLTFESSEGPGSLAGFAVAVGRFSSNSYGDIIFSAPLARNINSIENTIVGKVFKIQGGPNLNSSSIPSLIYMGRTFDNIPNPQAPNNPNENLTVGEIAGYSLAVSRTQTPDGKAVLTYSGSSTYDDLIIGAPNYQLNITNQWTNKSNLPSANQSNFPDTSSVSAGAAHIFTGRGSGKFRHYATYTGPNIPDSTGVGTNTFAGSNLTAGDLDGDGQQDLVISVPGLNSNAGGAYVLSGKALQGGNRIDSTTSPSPQALNTLNSYRSSSALQILGGLAGSRTGAVITFPGDLNHDGYQDLLITAPQAANGTGQSYVVFGSQAIFTQPNGIFDLNVTANGNKSTFLLNGNQPLQLAGSAATGAGDLNNDGVADLLITAPNGQQIYAVYGHPWLADDGSIKLADISSDNGFVIDGNEYTTKNSSPFVLAFALIYNDSNQLISAELQLISPTGQIVWNSNPGSDVPITPEAYAIMQSDGNLVIYGQPGGNTGDVIWSSGTSGSSGAVLKLATDGGLYLVLPNLGNSIIKTLNPGNTALLNTATTLNINSTITVAPETFLINGQSDGILLGNGRNVVMLGDVNGDGFADVLSGGSPAGGVVVFGNSTKDLLDAALGTEDLLVSVENAYVQKFVALGDFNGDGLNDFGVIDSNNKFYTVLGDPTLGTQESLALNGSPHTITNVTQAWAAGDVNGDGYGDVVLQIGNQSQLYWGNVSGELAQSINIPVSGGFPSSFTGVDINGNGLNEIVVGQPKSNPVSNIGGFQGGWQYFSYESNSLTVTSTLTSPNTPISQPLSGSWYAYSLSHQATNLTTSLAILDGWLYQAYFGTNGGIFLQRTRDGVNWQDLTELSTSTFDAKYPASIAAFNGSLYLGFTDNSQQVWVAEGTPVESSSSNPIGLQFTTPIKINQASNNGPTLVTFNNELYVFFIKNDSDDDILYSSSANPSSESSWSGNTALTINNEVQASDQPLSATVMPGENGTDTLAVAYKAKGKSNPYTATITLDSSGNLGNWQVSSLLTQVATGSQPSLIAVDGTYYLFFANSNERDLEYITSTDGINWDVTETIVGSSTDLVGVSSALFNQSFILSQINKNNNRFNFVTSEPFFESNQAINLGQQVYHIGDFNGDGLADLAVLAPGYRNLLTQDILDYNGINNLGGVFIYYGDTNGIASTTSPDVVLAAPDLPSETNFALLEITAIGDTNGDGFDDLLISSPLTTIAGSQNPSANGAQGVSWVVFGGTHWGNQYGVNSPFDLENLDNNQANNSQNFNPYGFVTTGLPNSQAGVSISGGADVNGDGFSDFVLGAPGNLDSLSFVFFGSDFNNQVNQTGTIGDDVMLGTPTGEIFVAGQGDDQIYTNGGVDTVYAGPGDDLVTVSDTNFRRLDGGSETNTLKFTGYTGQNWDLTTLSPGLRLKNFNILDIRNYGANTLTLNALTITKLSANNQIRVLLDASDTLNLDPSFSFSSTVYLDNQNYYRYTSSDSAATVLVNLPNNVIFTAPKTNTPALNLIPTALPSTPNSTNSPTLTATSSDPNQPTRLFVSNPTVSEASGIATFTVQRTGDLNKFVSISYLTQDGDGKAGNRYLPVAGRALFQPGETSKTISVPIPNDRIYRGNRQFGLLVSLLNEGTNGAEFLPVFHLSADGFGQQFRQWQAQPFTQASNSLLGGYISFNTTTTNGKSEARLSLQEFQASYNDFYSFNPELSRYESLMFDGTTGAKFWYEPGNSETVTQPSGINLFLEDGARGDVGQALDGLVKTQGYVGRTIPGLVTHNNQTFWAPTSADAQLQWRLVNAPNQSEFGLVAVDDAEGRIDDLLPTDPGYQAAALQRKQVIFANEIGGSSKALSRQIAQASFLDPTLLKNTEFQQIGPYQTSPLEASQFYLLYSQAGDKTTFSTTMTPEVTADSRGYHQVTLGEITIEVGSSAIVIPGAVGQAIAVTSKLSRAAAFTNTIGLYQVDSLTGGLDTTGDGQIDTRPGDENYTQAALQRAKDPLTGQRLTPPSNFATTTDSFNLLGSAMYGALIIPNATIEQVLTLNPTNQTGDHPIAFFSFGAANPDQLNHMTRLGANLFGFEDLLGGGDLDFNDTILQLSFAPTST